MFRTSSVLNSAPTHNENAALLSRIMHYSFGCLPLLASAGTSACLQDLPSGFHRACSAALQPTRYWLHSARSGLLSDFLGICTVAGFRGHSGVIRGCFFGVCYVVVVIHISSFFGSVCSGFSLAIRSSSVWARASTGFSLASCSMLLVPGLLASCRGRKKPACWRAHLILEFFVGRWYIACRASEDPLLQPVRECVGSERCLLFFLESDRAFVFPTIVFHYDVGISESPPSEPVRSFVNRFLKRHFILLGNSNDASSFRSSISSDLF